MATESCSSRWALPVTDLVEEQHRVTAIPQKTIAATAWGMNIYSEWAAARIIKNSTMPNVCDLTTPLLDMKPGEIAYWMGKFILEIRKKDGTEYPPKTLYQIVCCFKRHFEANGKHNINPLSNEEFGNFRRTLDAEMQRLHRKGLGTQPKQAEPITEDEESRLWRSGQLGKQSSQALLNTVYYYNCKMFGLRSQDEHRNLSTDQFEKKVDENGKVFLQFTGRASKTNRGGLHHMKINKVIRQYENLSDPQHCIVNIYVLYFTLIPKTGQFYYRPLPNKGELLRFSHQPIGINTLGQIIPKMCRSAGIEGRKSGHSGKVTCATTLYRKNFTDQQIQERTGHRSMEALFKYKRTSSIQHQLVSNALQPPPSIAIGGSTSSQPMSSTDQPSTTASHLQLMRNSEDEQTTKKPKLTSDISTLFVNSTLSQCTLNINVIHSQKNI